MARVPIRKTRLRTPDRRDNMGSYELFQRSGSLQARSMGQDDARAFDTQLRRGGEGLPQRYGVEKSAVC